MQPRKRPREDTSMVVVANGFVSAVRWRFRDAKNLQIPSGVHTLFDKAFHNNCNLTVIALPNTLKWIEKGKV